MTSILSRIASGANRFSGELLNPSNALGKFGAYLSAASGNPLGEAALASMRDSREQEGTELERQLKQMSIQAQLAKAGQPSNDYERIVARLGQDQGDSYLRAMAAGPPMAVDAIDATGATVRQYIPRTQLPGMAPSAPAGPPAGVTFTPIDGGAGAAAPRTFRRSVKGAR